MVQSITNKQANQSRRILWGAFATPIKPSGRKARLIHASWWKDVQGLVWFGNSQPIAIKNAQKIAQIGAVLLKNRKIESATVTINMP